MKSGSFTNLKGDLQGGFSSGLVTLLECIPLGLIALAPLGGEYANLGIIAGIYGAVFAGFFASLFGGSPGMITVPTPGICLMFGYVLMGIMDREILNPAASGYPLAVLTLGLFTLFLCGLIQLLLGFFKADYLIKFISYPVIAGIVTGVGILIVKTQVSHLFGFYQEFHFWSVCIGLFTAILLWNKSKLVKGPLGFPLVIAIGTAIYYLLFFLGMDEESLGGTIGQIPFKLPTPDALFSFLNLLGEQNFFRLLQILLPPALSLAIFCSLLSLLASLTLKNLTEKSPNSRQELIGQGIGNMIAACFGGLPSNGGFSRTILNFHEGGRTKLSGIVCSLSILILAFFLTFVIEYLPASMVAGIMIVLGIKLIDKWAVNLFYELITGKVKFTRELLVNCSIILAVIFIILSGYLIPAIGIGVMISIFFFLIRMRDALIRRIYEDQSIPSKKMHNESSMEYLSQHINEIKVIELAGIIYFGSAEKLANQIENLAERGVSYVILDMKRVDEIDLTGARLIEMVYRTMRKQGNYLAFSHIEEGSPLWIFLKNIHFFETIDRSFIFPDTDHALQYFEGLLLEKSTQKGEGVELKLSEVPVFQELTKEELEIIRKHLVRETYEKGVTIFEQGDAADSMYFILKGSVDVLISVGEKKAHRMKRLQSFSSGTFFGEMALFQKEVRSATVVATNDLLCQRLSYEEFQALVKDYSHLSVTLLSNISRILSKRLLFINQIISEMEK